MQNPAKLRIANSLVLSPTAYLLFAPSSILTVVIIESTRNPKASFLAMLGVSILSYLLFLLTLAVYYQLALKPEPQDTSSLITIALVGLALGALKGLGVTLLLALFELDSTQSPELLNRMLSGAALGAITIPGLAYLTSEIARLKSVRQTTLSALINTRIAQLEDSGVSEYLSEQIKSRYDQSFSSKLVAALNQSDTGSITANNADPILKDLATAMRQQLAEIASEVEDNSKQKYPELNLLNLLRYAVKNRPFPLLIIVPVLLLNSINYVLTSNPAEQATVRLAVITAVPVLLLSLGNALITRINRAKWVTWAIILTATVIATFGINALIFGDELGPLIPAIVIYEIWAIVVSLSAALLVAFNQQRNVIDTILANDLDESLIKQRALHQVNTKLLSEISEFIHGRVQSRLMASTVNISLAQGADDEQAIDEELSNLRDMADSPLKRFDSKSHQDIELSIRELSATWQGLLVITVESDSIKTLRAANASGIANVIEEALLNAFRHGQASQIQISAQNVEQILELTITDDGIGPRNGQSGIGSSLFDAFSNTWELTSGPNGIGSQLKLNFILQ
jgi:signal transduction histidine kinase